MREVTFQVTQKKIDYSVHWIETHGATFTIKTDVDPYLILDTKNVLKG